MCPNVQHLSLFTLPDIFYVPSTALDPTLCKYCLSSSPIVIIDSELLYKKMYNFP